MVAWVAWLTRITLVVCAGFVNCMNHLAGDGKLSPHQFEVAFFGYLRVTAGLDDLTSLGVTEVDTGAFSGCPICALTPECEQQIV